MDLPGFAQWQRVYSNNGATESIKDASTPGPLFLVVGVGVVGVTVVVVFAFVVVVMLLVG